MLSRLARWSSMSTPLPKPRVVTIVGSTGTGKSRLAVALAQKFNGEIINGDALQMYEGLPIATNKIPLTERKSIPHHLLGGIKLDEEPWKVGKYVHAASQIIGDIVTRGKLPIIVGGTHYYIQSLLFVDDIGRQAHAEYQSAQAQEAKWPILAASNQEMLHYLRNVDPEIASRWHPNDRRKIRHSLEVYFRYGRKPSDVWRMQGTATDTGEETPVFNKEVSGKTGNSPQDDSSALRFDPLLLHTYAEQDQLRQRLDRRVEMMVEDGLLEEVALMHHYLQKQQRSGRTVDLSSGIWAAIGFKELLPHVKAATAGHVDAEKMKKEGVELTRIATRQYAKSQQRWIRGKLLRALRDNSALDKIVPLDGTNLSLWSTNVERIASDAVSAFLEKRQIPTTTSTSTTMTDILVPKETTDIKARHCKMCNLTVMTQREWDKHPRTKKHRRAVKPIVDWAALYPKPNGRALDAQSQEALENG
ncbi:MAG: hypothetical protein Q9174_004137 [Haloplaca sp. 1 TL-2023]